jgi:uncharacterized phage-associated protein
MLTAAAVANEFLSLQMQEENSPPVDQMKLQKLVYYAHAWHLAIKGKELFEDDIEAWPWGPVVRNLYIEFKEFGSKPISGKRAKIIVKDGNNNPLDWRVVTPYVIDPETKVFIKSVWDSHKEFTGIQLSNATHIEGEPWAIVRESMGGDLRDKPKIENELIKQVFKLKLEQNDSCSAPAE